MSVRTTVKAPKGPHHYSPPSRFLSRETNFKQTFTGDERSTQDIALKTSSGHDFSRVQVHPNQSQTAGQVPDSCPLSLSTPRGCPFGGACHICPAQARPSRPGIQQRSEAEEEAEEEQYLQPRLFASRQGDCCDDEPPLGTQPRVDPTRVNTSRCRTCIIRTPTGACDFWLHFSQSAIVRDLTNADSGAIDYALRAYHMIGLQRMIFGTSLYNTSDSFNVTFRQRLRNRFNLDIENNAHHNRIRRVENRYRGVARLLESGRVRYRCRCDDETAWAESYNHSASNPRMWICRHFLDNNDATERALTLLHECLHILYGLGHSGTMNNIFRYEELATDLETIPIPAVSLPPGVSPEGETEPTAAGAGGGAEAASRKVMRPSSGVGDDLHKETEPEEEGTNPIGRRVPRPGSKADKVMDQFKEGRRL